jgi:UDPglucose--hexose-1-phosphate uridylyltransferase
VSASGHRVDSLTGRVTYMVPNRQSRPDGSREACPFCPGGLEAPEPYQVRWFPNRWPPLPDGRAEIVLYTPDHRAALWQLGPAGVRRVVDLWAERSGALGGRPDVVYVLVFENRGAAVGATVDHPHGQIYAFDRIPPTAAQELARPPSDGLPSDAAGADDERLVVAGGGWRAWVPEAASWPYELLIAPDGPQPDLPSVDDEARDGLAEMLVAALARLDGLFGAPMPYMLWIHQRPFDGRPWPSLRMHVHIAPLLRAPATPRYVAAGELGSGVSFNPVDPVAAADALRSVAVRA